MINITKVTESLDAAVMRDVERGVTLYESTNKWKSSRFYGTYTVEKSGNLILALNSNWEWGICITPSGVTKKVTLE